MDRLEDSLLGKNSDLKKLLPACFYENMLPLGFCCSPILSDFYLSDIDKKYENDKGMYIPGMPTILSLVPVWRTGKRFWKNCAKNFGTIWRAWGWI